MSRTGGGRRPLAGLVGGFVAGAVLIAGCGTGPATTPPAGVDELVVPTPTPEAGDFVADVDNPWWPLRPGTTSTYRDERGREVLRTVGPAEEVAGVTAYGVVTEPVATTWGSGAPAPTTEWFAQDRRGNVWLVGGRTDDGTVWEAGEGGAGAGLVVTAVPRTGDGYVRREAAAVPALGASVVRVLAVGDEVQVDGEVLEAVLLEEQAPDASGGSGGSDAGAREVTLARGVGLTSLATAEGTWRLVALPEPGDTAPPT